MKQYGRMAILKIFADLTSSRLSRCPDGLVMVANLVDLRRRRTRPDPPSESIEEGLRRRAAATADGINDGC